MHKARFVSHFRLSPPDLQFLNSQHTEGRYESVRKVPWVVETIQLPFCMLSYLLPKRNGQRISERGTPTAMCHISPSSAAPITGLDARHMDQMPAPDLANKTAGDQLSLLSMLSGGFSFLLLAWAQPLTCLNTVPTWTGKNQSQVSSEGSQEPGQAGPPGDRS